MEELRSTDILDREIHEDARKKAEKILKDGEKEAGRILDDVSLRIEKVREEKRREYERMAQQYRQETESAIPLEKQRRIVSFVDKAVTTALEGWFSALTPDRRIAIYAGMIDKFRPIIGKKDVVVRFTGYTGAAVKEILCKLFNPVSQCSVSELSAGEAAKLGFTDGIHLETADRSIVCRATREELFEELLSVHRQELALALMGGRLPE